MRTYDWKQGLTRLDRSLNRKPNRKPRRRSKSRPKKSSFVKFFETLEKRGPLKPYSIFEIWTKKIRDEMTAIGTWPKGQKAADHVMVAEYVSRLQALFWQEHPHLKGDRRDFKNVSYDDSRIFVRTFRSIFRKIRAKGLRDRTFILALWSMDSITWTWVKIYNRPVDGTINIWPYEVYVFNDHGAGI